MKLFLTSVGLEPEYQKDFLQLLDKDPHKTKLAFIPTACDPEPDKSYVKQTRDEIEATGIQIFDIDLKEENEKSLNKKLEDVDVICVNGGNTFYLLDWVRKSGFDKVIKKFIRNEKIYFGVSAGSYLACPTIEAAGWKDAEVFDDNVVNLTDLSGLNLIPFILTAHFEEINRKATEKCVKNTLLPVVSLTDKQAIIIEGNNIKVVGEGKRNFFNEFKEKKYEK